MNFALPSTRSSGLLAPALCFLRKARRGRCADRGQRMAFSEGRGQRQLQRQRLSAEDVQPRQCTGTGGRTTALSGEAGALKTGVPVAGMMWAKALRQDHAQPVA